MEKKEKMEKRKKGKNEKKMNKKKRKLKFPSPFAKLWKDLSFFRV